MIKPSGCPKFQQIFIDPIFLSILFVMVRTMVLAASRHFASRQQYVGYRHSGLWRAIRSEDYRDSYGGLRCGASTHATIPAVMPGLVPGIHGFLRSQGLLREHGLDEPRWVGAELPQRPVMFGVLHARGCANEV